MEAELQGTVWVWWEIRMKERRLRGDGKECRMQRWMEVFSFLFFFFDFSRLSGRAANALNMSGVTSG